MLPARNPPPETVTVSPGCNEPESRLRPPADGGHSVGTGGIEPLIVTFTIAVAVPPWPSSAVYLKDTSAVSPARSGLTPPG